MKILWEENVCSRGLSRAGKIDAKSLLPKTTTYQFPSCAATVRMAGLTSMFPRVTIHVKGNPKKHTYLDHNGVATSYETYPTVRVTFGGAERGDPTKAIPSIIVGGTLNSMTMTMAELATIVEDVKNKMKE